MWKVGVLLTICIVSCLSQVLVTSEDRCIPDGELCQNHNECCSASCLEYSSRCARNPNYYQPSSLDRNTLQVLVNNLFASTERPANYDVPPSSLSERFGGDEATPPSTQDLSGVDEVVTERDCKIVGMKCYRDSECCTKRCHGFLHQCVT